MIGLVMERMSDLLNRLCEMLLIIVLIAMAVSVFLQVLFRYLLHFPLFWTEEFARYCLVWASLLGAAVALKRGEHIAVTLFLDRFPKSLAHLSVILGRTALLLILGVMVVGGIKLVLITRVQISPALRIPMAVPYLALPVGSAVMLFHVITSFFHKPGGTPHMARPGKPHKP
ncbi:MAG: TRAP transporter small permease [Desulfobacterales bacterium]|nr:TRAP transporter small permease [Desulfobacterales bacterium]